LPYRRKEDYPEECFSHIHRERCQYAEDAADRAVEKTFARLGVDVNNPSELKKFQDSLRFGEKLLNMADKGIIAAIVTGVGMLMAALFLGIKTKIMGQP
jgi:DNA helicase IV